MPTILPPTRNQLGEVIAALEALGGRAKTDFRLTSTRWGATALDVTDELYAAWESKNTPTPPAEPNPNPVANTEPNADGKPTTRKSSGGK